MVHRIQRITLHRVDVSKRTDWLIVEVTSSEGLTGSGECSDLRPIGAAGEILDAVADDLRHHVIGTDVMELDERMTRRFEATADPALRFQRRLVLGAAVTALCDINAQVERQPLSLWLGGVLRPTVDLYANINRAPVERRSDEFAEVAARAVDAGFNRLKLAPFDGPPMEEAKVPLDWWHQPPGTLTTGISHLHAVREAVGSRPTVLVDVHHRLAEEELEPAVRAMEELGVGWIEDAVDVRRPDQLEKLASMTKIPIAGGEQLTDEREVAALCAGGWLDYLLLDPKYIGGPLRFSSMLDVVDDVTLTLHDPTGPISTAVSSHLTMLTQNSGPLEYAFGENIDRDALSAAGERVNEGRLDVNQGSGIGTRLDAVGQPRIHSRTWPLH